MTVKVTLVFKNAVAIGHLINQGYVEVEKWWCHYLLINRGILVLGEKGRDLTQSYDKSPYTNRNVKRAKWQHQQRHKKFDYTAVADRLRTVSLSNYGHPTGVVNLVYGPNLPTPRNSRVIKMTLDKGAALILPDRLQIMFQIYTPFFPKGLFENGNW